MALLSTSSNIGSLSTKDFELCFQVSISPCIFLFTDFSGCQEMLWIPFIVCYVRFKSVYSNCYSHCELAPDNNSYKGQSFSPSLYQMSRTAKPMCLLISPYLEKKTYTEQEEATFLRNKVMINTVRFTLRN